jgi:hypothetical protein
MQLNLIANAGAGDPLIEEVDTLGSRTTTGERQFHNFTRFLREIPDGMKGLLSPRRGFAFASAAIPPGNSAASLSTTPW